MSWPITFGTLATGNQPASDFDTMFNAAGVLTVIPCTCVTSGGDSTLTPISNTPDQSAGPANYQLYSFYTDVADASSFAVAPSAEFYPLFSADGTYIPNVPAATFLVISWSSVYSTWTLVSSDTLLDQLVGYFGDTTGSILYANGSEWTTLPVGSEGQVLTVGASSALEWTEGGGGGGSPGGSANSVQYNDAGSFGGVLLGSGNILIGQSSAAPEALSISGDAVLSAAGALTVTKTDGTDFGTLATSTTSGSSILMGNGSGGVGNVTVSTGLSLTSSTLTNSGVTELTAGTGISLSASTGSVTITNTGGSPGGSTNDIQYNAGSGDFGGITVSSGQLLVGQSSAEPAAKSVGGDASLAADGTLTVTKTNGTAFGDLATVSTSGANVLLGNGSGGIANATLAGGLSLSSGTLTAGIATGTFTPTDESGASLTFTAKSGSYLNIGNLWFIVGQATYPSTANGDSVVIGGLPVTIPSGPGLPGQFGTTVSGEYNFGYTNPIASTSTANFGYFSGSGFSFITNANLSEETITFSLIIIT